jgi:hypothetical protein
MNVFEGVTKEMFIEIRNNHNNRIKLGCAKSQ